MGLRVTLTYKSKLYYVVPFCEAVSRASRTRFVKIGMKKQSFGLVFSFLSYKDSKCVPFIIFTLYTMPYLIII